MRRAAVIALACAPLSLAACGGQHAPAQARRRPPRARSSAAAGARAATATGARAASSAQPAVTVAAGQPYVAIASFRSPHGEIACAIDASTARCSISRPRWAARSPCPSTPTQVLALRRRGPGRFDCARGAAPAGGASVKALPYGTVALAHGFVCESYPGGVQCATDHNGHGFFISPPLVRLF